MHYQQAHPQGPKFNRQHIPMAYQIQDDTMELLQTDDGKFTLTFKYSAQSNIMCSLFTFVEETFNVETFTTENMVHEPQKGGEQHLTLPATGGKQEEATISNVTVKPDIKYYFTETMQNNYYPMIIRYVNYSRLGTEKRLEQSG